MTIVVPAPPDPPRSSGGGSDPLPGVSYTTVATASALPADPTALTEGTTYYVADEARYFVAGDAGWFMFQGGGGSFTYLYEWQDGLPLCSDPGQPLVVDDAVYTTNQDAWNPQNVEAAHFLNPFQLNSMIVQWWALGPRVLLTLEAGATVDKFLLRTAFGMAMQNVNGDFLGSAGGNPVQTVDFSAGQPSSFDGNYYVELPQQQLSGRVEIPRGDRMDIGVIGSVERSGFSLPTDPVAVPEPKLKACVLTPATIIARGILGP